MANPKIDVDVDLKTGSADKELTGFLSRAAKAFSASQIVGAIDSLGDAFEKVGPHVLKLDKDTAKLVDSSFKAAKSFADLGGKLGGPTGALIGGAFGVAVTNSKELQDLIGELIKDVTPLAIAIKDTLGGALSVFVDGIRTARREFYDLAKAAGLDISDPNAIRGTIRGDQERRAKQAGALKGLFESAGSGLVGGLTSAVQGWAEGEAPKRAGKTAGAAMGKEIKDALTLALEAAVDPKREGASKAFDSLVAKLAAEAPEQKDLIASTYALLGLESGEAFNQALADTLKNTSPFAELAEQNRALFESMTSDIETHLQAAALVTNAVFNQIGRNIEQKKKLFAGVGPALASGLSEAFKLEGKLFFGEGLHSLAKGFAAEFVPGLQAQAAGFFTSAAVDFGAAALFGFGGALSGRAAGRAAGGGGGGGAGPAGGGVDGGPRLPGVDSGQVTQGTTVVIFDMRSDLPATQEQMDEAGRRFAGYVGGAAISSVGPTPGRHGEHAEGVLARLRGDR